MGNLSEAQTSARSPTQKSAGSRLSATSQTPGSDGSVSAETDSAERLQQDEGSSLGAALFALVKAEDGSVIPLPPGTEYTDFIEWIAAKVGPGYGINSVELTGQVEEGDRIELQAVVTIVVLRDETWVRVPLGFQEAVLGHVAHEGEGNWAYDGFSREEGHAWKLTGKGEHRLTLTLLAPLTHETNDTRLVLTTPQRAATTHLKLEFPSDVEVQSDARAMLTINRPTAETTIANWIGPGGQIELSWHPRPETARPEDLTVRTTMVVSLTSQECEIQARQTITPDGGRIAHVDVLLPDGFSFVSVEGDFFRQGTAQISEDGRTVSLDLTEPRASPVELNWRVTAPLQDSAPLTINNFLLPEVPKTSQLGEVHFKRNAAYRRDVITEERATFGIAPTGGMIPLGVGNVAASYVFVKQPFSITFNVEPIIPVFDISPALMFTVRPDGIDLDAKFSVDLEEGALKEMRFRWPADRWKISQIRDGYIQETDRASDQSPPIIIQVPSGIDFEIPILATMPRENLAGSFSVPMPQIEAMTPEAVARRQDRVLTVRLPNNASVTVRGPDGEVLPRLEDPSAVRLPKSSDNESTRTYMVPAMMAEVEFDVEQLQRHVDTSTTINVRPRGEELMVKQWFVYDISFAPVTELHFQIPESIFAEGLQFVDGSGGMLPLEAQSRQEGLVSAMVPLQASVTGPFSLSVRYNVPLGAEKGSSGQLVLPVIRAVDGEFHGARLDVASLPYHDLTMASSSWKAVSADPDEDNNKVWQSSTMTSAVKLKITAKPPEAISRPTIRKVLLRTVIGSDGDSQTIVDCLFDQPIPPLVLTVPSNAELGGFHWRQRQINPEITESAGGKRIALALDEGAGDPVLSFSYHLSGSGELGFFDAVRIPQVNFGDDIAIGEVVWRVSLHDSAHLFGYPNAYRPRFSWRLNAGLWSRQPVPSLAEVETWFSAELADTGPQFQQGNEYVFSRQGSVEPLMFTVIAKSLVVLIGAGLAILLGYTFANGLIAYPRYVLLGLVIVVLLIWAFFPNQVKIFMQPAILGLCLVALALLAERLLQRRQDRLNNEAATSSAVDFVTILPHDGSVTEPPPGIGSEEPTVVRSGTGSHQSHDHG